jgi:predicted secreted hydrolase
MPIFKLFISLFFILYISSAYANLPYYPIQFPRDDAAHYSNVPYPVNNLTEWWYYNGKVVTTEGRQLGYMISIFNINNNMSKTQSMKYSQSILMMQITDLASKKVYGKTIEYLNQSANFNCEELSIHLRDDFSLSKLNDSYLLTANVKVNDGPFIKINLTLSPTKLPLLVNGNGLIDMWDNTNSYYYSNTRLKTEGDLQINNEHFDINSSLSHSWMDHQWGDFTVDSKAAQWIWSSIMLDDGTDLSVMELVDPKTEKVVSRYANIIINNNTVYTSDFEFTPGKIQGKNKYPQTYQVFIPSINLQLALDSMSPNQDSLGFWDGIHNVSGFSQNGVATGFSYVENTIVFPRRYEVKQ